MELLTPEEIDICYEKWFRETDNCNVSKELGNTFSLAIAKAQLAKQHSVHIIKGHEHTEEFTQPRSRPDRGKIELYECQFCGACYVPPNLEDKDLRWHDWYYYKKNCQALKLIADQIIALFDVEEIEKAERERIITELFACLQIEDAEIFDSGYGEMIVKCLFYCAEDSELWRSLKEGK